MLGLLHWVVLFDTERTGPQETRPNRMKQHLLLGTAGHIDHGKTSLVKALTGVETDRLPEEKRRKITIELGFAPLELASYQIGIVDVPGHERFVKTMLAGATGVDLAMLVVAADDSVKPQTREHLEILEYLSLKAGVIVITKCDLAEPDWIDLVESEIRELVAGSKMESAPIVRVSALSGEGLELLRQEISLAADRAMQSRILAPESPFRMAIDRVFTVSGYGTVVTGSIASGRICVGDETELQPQGVKVRVRGLQSHDTEVQEIGLGQRAAINLGGIHYDEIARGQSLASQGTLRTSRVLTISLCVSEQISHAVKHRTRIRFHVGASETQATLSLLGLSAVEPGERVFAQVFLAEEVAVAWGQPLVIRAVSPQETLGGGRVLVVGAAKIKRLTETIREQLTQLESDDSIQRASAAAYFAGSRPWQTSDLHVLAGVESPEEDVDRLIADKVLRCLPLDRSKSQLLHCEILRQICDRVERFLGVEHKKTPLHAMVERSRLSRYFVDLRPTLLDACLATLEEEGRVLIGSHGLSLAGWSPELSQRERELLERVVAAYLKAELQPPSAAQLAESYGDSEGSLASLINVAVEQGSLVRISKEMFLHVEVEKAARRLLSENMRDGQERSMSEIRELLKTSRKFAVPFCEYLDAMGFTRRVGNQRILVTS